VAKAHASAGEQLYMCAAKRTPCTTARPTEPAGPIVTHPAPPPRPTRASRRTPRKRKRRERAGLTCEDDRPMLADWGYQMGSNRPGFPVGFHERDARGDDERVARRCKATPKHRRRVGWGTYGCWVACHGSLERSPDPTGTSAHRSSTRACPRSLPSSAWSGAAFDVM